MFLDVDPFLCHAYVSIFTLACPKMGRFSVCSKRTLTNQSLLLLFLLVPLNGPITLSSNFHTSIGVVRHNNISSGLHSIRGLRNFLPKTHLCLFRYHHPVKLSMQLIATCGFLLSGAAAMIQRALIHAFERMC